MVATSDFENDGGTQGYGIEVSKAQEFSGKPTPELGLGALVLISLYLLLSPTFHILHDLESWKPIIIPENTVLKAIIPKIEILKDQNS